MTEEDLKELESCLFFSPLPPKTEALVTRLISAYREQQEIYQSVAATQQRQLAEQHTECEQLRYRLDHAVPTDTHVAVCRDLERQLAEAREEIERLRKEVACWSLVWDEDCPNAHQAKRLPSQAPDYP